MPWINGIEVNLKVGLVDILILYLLSKESQFKILIIYMLKIRKF